MTLSGRYNNIMAASDLALESNVSIRHGAIIVSDGNIVATGFNKNELNRKKILTKYGPKNQSLMIHAEIAALYDLITSKRYGVDNYNIRRKKLDLYVARDNMTNSKPCQHCIEILQHFGIYRVIYSTTETDENYICEKVSNIENDWISKGNRFYFKTR